ncbi:hypothetical protein GW17_00004892 [Ensete ventricosum]|nr:hypothetical protein GW17_00004892 [Ensete ventricosum]
MDDSDKRDSEKKLHTRLRLWQFPDKYILEPIDGFADSYLSISRTDGSINLIGILLKYCELLECSTTQSPKIHTIFGVIGILKLLLVKLLDKRDRLDAIEEIEAKATFWSEEDNQDYLVGVPITSWGDKYCVLQRLHELGNESKLLPLWRQAVSTWLLRGKKKQRERRKKKEKEGEPRCVPIRHRPPSTIPIQYVMARQQLGFFAAFFAEGRRRLWPSTSLLNTTNEEKPWRRHLLLFSSSPQMRRRLCSFFFSHTKPRHWLFAAMMLQRRCLFALQQCYLFSDSPLQCCSSMASSSLRHLDAATTLPLRHCDAVVALPLRRFIVAML